MRAVPNRLLLAVLMGWAVALVFGPGLRFSLPVFILACLVTITSVVYQVTHSTRPALNKTRR